jgi:hypothetical protein
MMTNGVVKPRCMFHARGRASFLAVAVAPLGAADQRLVHYGRSIAGERECAEPMMVWRRVTWPCTECLRSTFKSNDTLDANVEWENE